jgi:hypothetical protein
VKKKLGYSTRPIFHSNKAALVAHVGCVPTARPIEVTGLQARKNYGLCNLRPGPFRLFVFSSSAATC